MIQESIILYLPVIQKGYIDFVNKYPKSRVYIIDQSLISFIDKEFDYLRKEIRALEPLQAKKSLEAIFPNRIINLLSLDDFLKKGSNKENKFVLPREDIFIWLAKKYLPNSNINFDNTFLRWNRNNSTKKQQFESITKISKNKFNKKIISTANNEKELSSDWWRQISAVLFKKNKIIEYSHNRHIPTPYTLYIDSDPRNSFHKGENIDISTAIHAEADLISKAAKNGVSLSETELYVTTFPCPTCSKLIANSGIKKLYFEDGYSITNGEKILKDAEIEIIKIED